MSSRGGKRQSSNRRQNRQNNTNSRPGNKVNKPRTNPNNNRNNHHKPPPNNNTNNTNNNNNRPPQPHQSNTANGRPQPTPQPAYQHPGTNNKFPVNTPYPPMYGPQFPTPPYMDYYQRTHSAPPILPDNNLYSQTTPMQANFSHSQSQARPSIPQQQKQSQSTSAQKRERRPLTILDPKTNTPIDLNDENNDNDNDNDNNNNNNKDKEKEPNAKETEKRPTDEVENTHESQSESDNSKTENEVQRSEEKEATSQETDSHEKLAADRPSPSKEEETPSTIPKNEDVSEENRSVNQASEDISSATEEKTKPNIGEEESAAEEQNISNGTEPVTQTDADETKTDSEKPSDDVSGDTTRETTVPNDNKDDNGSDTDSDHNKGNEKDSSDESEADEASVGEGSSVADSEGESGEEDKEGAPVIRLSRDKILQLRNKARSKEPPEGLQGLEIFQDPSKPRTPNRRQTSHRRSRKSPGRGGGGRRGRRGPRTPSGPVKKEWQLAKSDDEKVLRDARLVINKITPEKYEKLKSKLLSLEITTAPRLQGVIEIIFELAVNVQNYCEMYASLCRDVSLSTEELGPDVSKHFRTALITLCQKEFEHAPPVDETLSEEDKKEQAFINKKRMMGNMKFIGELFKQRMLSERIMHTVIETLFKRHDDESMEQLTILLTKIGKLLDHFAPEKMNKYFELLDAAKDNTDLSFRTRCLIMDVIDLRAANWVPRREEVQAKKIEDIHKEVKQKQTPKTRSSRDGGNKSGRSSNRSSPIFKNRSTPSSGRRSGSSTPRSRGRDTRTGGSSSTAWNRSSTTSSASSKSERKSDSLSTKNSFGALEENSYELRPNSGRTEKRVEETTPTSSPSVSPKVTEKKPEEGEALSADKVKLKSGNLIDEYVKLGDKKEAAITFKELGENNFAIFARVFLEKVTEAPPATFQSLFAVTDILEENGVTFKHILEGARQVVNRAIEEDLYFDVPQLFVNLGAVCAVFVNHQLLSFEQIKDNLLDAKDMDDDYIGDMMFGFICYVKNTNTIAERLRNTNINLFKLINPLSRQFTKKWKMLVDNDADLSMDVCLYIYDAIMQNKSTTDIEKWLQGISSRKEPWFAHKTASAVIAADLSLKEEDAQPGALREHARIIKFVATSTEHQLQVLQAMALMFKNLRSKPGKGKMMFESLSDIFDADIFAKFKDNYKDKTSTKLVEDIEK